MATMTGMMRLQQVERDWLSERVERPSLVEALRAVLSEGRGRNAGYQTLVEARRGLEFGQLMDAKWMGARV